MKTLIRAFLAAVALSTMGCTGEEFTAFSGGSGAGGEDGGADTGSAGAGGEDAGAGGHDAGSGGMAGAGGEDAGSGGGGLGGTGGSGGSPSICTPGETKCDGLDVETCNQAGTAWNVTETCPFLCDQGACTGVCLPGTNQCNGVDVETCDGQGQWQTTSTCPFVCSNGACSGVCLPGSMKCDGQTPQTCDGNGQWVDGSACQYVCSQGTCTGSCTPGTIQCNGTTVQTCNNQGTWDNTQVCPYVCQAGSCTGVCVPGSTQCSGNTVQTCGSNGQWQSGSACPFICQAGACTGVCVPGSVKCSGSSTQTCNSNAQWAAPVACPGAPNANPTCSNGTCGWTCQAGFDDCTGAPGCESNLSNPATCGSCNNTCNSSGGTATCSMGTCGITCDSQHANCNMSASDGCEVTLGTTTNCTACGNVCTAPANSVAVCTQSGCDYACTGLWDDCNGLPGDGCEYNVSSDPWNCGGCGISCHGGTCSNGVCVEGATKVADALDVTSIALGTVYNLGEVYWTEAGGDVEKAPAAGGQATVMATGQADPQAAVTDGSKIIWSNTYQFNRAIRAVPTGGGPSFDLVTGYGPLELTHDGANLYWNDQLSYEPCYCTQTGQTNIWRMSLSGGPPAIVNTVLNSKAYPSWPGVVVDAANVYRLRWEGAAATSSTVYVDKTNPNLHGTTTGGFTYNSVWQGIAGGKNLSITPDETTIAFWGQYTATSSGKGIIKAKPGVTSAEPVNANIGLTIVDMTLDNTHAYVIRKKPQNSTSDHPWCQIIKVDLANGALTVLLDHQFNADHIEVDGTHVYWYTEGYKFANPNPSVPDVPEKAILRMPK